MRIMMLTAALLTLAACGNDKPPATVNLDRYFILVDEQGQRAGTAIFRPLGEGEIRDNSNTLIGVISKPD